ncbi:hypothetical protein S245_061440, partial [Arachis hypogaea]
NFGFGFGAIEVELKGILDSDLVPLKLRVFFYYEYLARIHPKEVELVDLIYRERISCAFVRMEISLLIAKIIMLHSTIRGH